MSSNDTMRVAPEISLFLKNVFLKKNGINISDYENISFSAIWAYRLFSHSSEEDKWLTNNDILLHVGNLQFIFEEGEKFELTNNLNDLQGIKDRFHLESLQQAHVFYEYLNFMVEEFGCQKSANGTSGQAFISSAVSLEIYKNFKKISDYLYFEILSGLIFFKIKENNLTCTKLMNISEINETRSSKFCSDSKINNLEAQNSIKSMVELCENPERKRLSSNSTMMGLNKIDLLILCEADTKNQTTFSSLKKSAEMRIHSFYSCSKNNFSCTKDEISKKQWGNSTITMNPLPELLSLSAKYKQSLSVHQWDSDLFPKPFEYLAAFNYTFDVLSINNKPVHGFDDSISNKLLSFDRLFGQAIRYLFTDYAQQNYAKLKEFFYIDEIEPLNFYLKYTMIEFALQGFVQKRSISEMLWGYDDPLISMASKMNPALGGDPSLNPKVSLATNLSYEDALNYPQSVYSGEGDPSKARVYSSVYNLDFVTFKDAVFDGNKTTEIYTNPWKEKVPYEGTDSFCNGPDRNKDSIIHIYMTDACFGGPAEYLEDVDHDGLHTLRFATKESFMQNKTNNPKFDKFYMDRWNQALNTTSFKKMPVFITKFRYLNLDEEPIKDLEIYTNENKTEKVKPSSEFEIHIDVEPYTGGAVSASLNIHTSYEYQQDELFMNQKYVFLPLLGIVRPGTWSSKAVIFFKITRIHFK